MDKNNSIQNSSQSNNNVFYKTDNSALFTGKKYLSYVHKKSEKISNVLYLLAGFFDDNEPIKKTLKDKAILFLSKSCSLLSAKPLETLVIAKEINAVIFEIISLCDIAFHSGLIISNNNEVIRRELVSFMNIIDSIKDRDDKMGFILDEKFFSDPSVEKYLGHDKSAIVSGVSFMNQTSFSNVLDKGHFIKDNRMSFNNVRKETKSNVVGKSRDDSKQERRKTIIGLLASKPEITVKDISIAVSNCSEKTLQRELLDMVAQGLLKKTGERRWSKYSLISAPKNTQN